MDAVAIGRTVSGYAVLACALLGCAGAPPAGESASGARIAVSANEAKVFLENGTIKTAPVGAVDSVTVIDLRATPPRVIGEVQAPASVVGPPTSVAVAPDESIALVTSATKRDPSDPSKIVPDSRVSVIDLRSSPPRVLATLEAGAGAAGVSINRQGSLALVANRNEGTVSAFAIRGASVSPRGKVKVGEPTSGPSHVVFTPDGRRALLTRDGDHGLVILAIDGETVTVTDRTFYAGLRPYGADVSRDGRWAVVANIGRGQGDADTVSLVDMTAAPPRTVDTVTVGATPEGVKLAPDGRTVAVVTHNGTGRPSNSPLYNPNGRLVMLTIDDGRLRRGGEAPIGKWSQGVVFGADSKLVLVQNMVERNIQVFRLDGDRPVDTGQVVALPAGGAAIRTAEP